jgi:mannose-6-phosphate isomerase-like protein (cupin superfamily)
VPVLIPKPTRIEAVGNKPIVIDEYCGLVNTREARLSVARIQCPAGWVEPGQTPEFDEYTVVLSGLLRVASKDGNFDVAAGQAILTRRGEWVQYSTLGPEGADYLAVCLPAYSPEHVNRDP